MSREEIEGKCRCCFETAETEPVKVRDRSTREWVDSSLLRCVNKECHAIRAGTDADRIAHINDVYGYKYFGDYELSPEQIDAVGEAVKYANRVPALLAENERLERIVIQARKVSDVLAVYGFPVSDAHWKNASGDMSVEARGLHLAATDLRAALNKDPDQ